MNDTLLWYTTRGAGTVSLIMLTGVVLLGVLSTTRFQTQRWPRFLTTGLHRNVALLALVFLGIHIITAVVDPFTHLGWLAAVIPFSSYYRTFWLGLGVIAFELFIAIIVTSLLRAYIGHTVWRAIHWLTYGSWPVAVIHWLGTGTDVWSAWFFVITASCVGLVVFAVVYRLLTRSSDPLDSARTAFRSGVERNVERNVER
jgi:methionine sulfoxide reductase heme-binding subunit